MYVVEIFSLVCAVLALFLPVLILVGNVLSRMHKIRSRQRTQSTKTTSESGVEDSILTMTKTLTVRYKQVCTAISPWLKRKR